jgi:Secretion system C-terminal sorting domain
LIHYSQVVIYPNPTDNAIIIKGLKEELSQIRIYNLLGQDVTPFTKIIHENNTTVMVDLSGLRSGMYTVRTITGVSKISKQ